jgi:hypothetical protein
MEIAIDVKKIKKSVLRPFGWAYSPNAIAQEIQESLLNYSKTLDFTPANRRQGKVDQEFNQASASMSHPDLLWLCSALDNLTSNVCEESFPITTIDVHQYSAGGYITRHRDFKRNLGLIYLLTLEGSAQFTIDDVRRNEITTQPRSLLILRGVLPDDEKDYRPYHRVSSLTNRVSIGLRHFLPTGGRY